MRRAHYKTSSYRPKITPISTKIFILISTQAKLSSILKSLRARKIAMTMKIYYNSVRNGQSTKDRESLSIG